MKSDLWHTQSKREKVARLGRGRSGTQDADATEASVYPSGNSGVEMTFPSCPIETRGQDLHPNLNQLLNVGEAATLAQGIAEEGCPVS